MTRLFKHPLNDGQFDAIVEALAQGELVILPTETVYGLAADAFSDTAIQAIFRAKQRPANNPIIVHIASIEDINDIVADVPEIALKLAEAFWPGPLTMVFEKSEAIPAAVCAGGNTVGVRVPNQQTTQKIIEKFGPIAAPSANLYTELSPTEVKHLNAELLNSVTIVVDGGDALVGIESTVLSVVDNKPVLLRPGMISRQEISAVIDMPVTYKKIVVPDGKAHPSPGLTKKHYSPKTRVVIGTPPRTPERINVGYISYTKSIFANIIQQVHQVESPSAYASQFYGSLHLLDNLELDVIYVEPLPNGEDWQALRDRLERASS